MMWHYAIGEKRGQSSLENLARGIQNGRLGPDTLVWTEGMSEWLPLKDTELAQYLPAAPAATSPKVPPTPPSHPKQVSCTNCGKTISEQAVACMSCGAKPTGHKKFCRQCGVALNPEQVVCTQCGATIKAGNFAMDGTNSMPTNLSADVTRRKGRLTFWTVWCITFYIILTLLNSVFRGLIYGSDTDDGVAAILGTAYWVLSLIGIVYLCGYYIWLRRLWEEVPSEFARTSPGNAALFALVPLYALYWQFIAFCGLYGDMNKATKSYGLGPCFNEVPLRLICIWWVIYGVIGGLPKFFSSNSVAISLHILLTLITVIISVAVYWSVQKNVLKFIDIKSNIDKKSPTA